MSDQMQKIVDTGKMLQDAGVKYKLGAKAMPPVIPVLLDCSGFVRYCFRAGGIKIPDGTYYQFLSSKKINEEDLRVGDVGFRFSPDELKGRVNHIGIYTGDGHWMHCNYSRNGITIERTKVFKHFRRFESNDNKAEISKNQQQVQQQKRVERRKPVMVKIKINGEVKELNGFEEKNTNFVSVRELAEILGKNVKYDEKNQVIEIE